MGTTKTATLQKQIKDAFDCYLNSVTMSQAEIVANCYPEGSTVRSIFESEYGWRVDQVGLQRACRDYLQGLPTIFNHAFYNNNIIDLFNKGVLIKPNHVKTDDAAIDYYWHGLAMALVRIIENKRGLFNVKTK